MSVPEVVMRATPEPFAPRSASLIKGMILKHFGQFADRSLDIILSYQRLDLSHRESDPSAFRQEVMRRAQLLNPYINFYYMLSLVSSHPNRLRSEISRVLLDYQTLFAQHALLPLESGEGLDLQKISVRSLPELRWLGFYRHAADPHPEGFVDEHGNLRLWAQVGGAEVQLSVPWNDTVRILVGQVAVGVLAQLGQPTDLSGKREILRWLRANLDIWVRFLQDAAFAAQATTIYNIAQDKTVINARFTPLVVRSYVLGRFPALFASVPRTELPSVTSFGWWRIEQDPHLEKCKTIARDILDTYYGKKLLESTLVAPCWVREPDALSVDLYLLYVTDDITSYLLQCSMAHLAPSLVMMHRIHDILNELQVLLQRNSLNRPIPIPFNLLPLDDLPLDLFLACDATEQVGRKPRNQLDSAQWLEALTSLITSPSKSLRLHPDQWIRCLCGAIGAFYVLYHDMDYDLVPDELHNQLQLALHAAWKVVPERCPELKYVLPYPPIIPRRIREQYRDVYGNTSADSHQALTEHIINTVNTIAALSERVTAVQTSSTVQTVGGGRSDDLASNSRPRRTTPGREIAYSIHGADPGSHRVESLPHHDADPGAVASENSREHQISSLALATSRSSYTRHESIPVGHDDDGPQDPSDSGWNDPPDLSGSGWNDPRAHAGSALSQLTPAAASNNGADNETPAGHHSNSPGPPPSSPSTASLRIRDPLAEVASGKSAHLPEASPSPTSHRAKSSAEAPSDCESARKTASLGTKKRLRQSSASPSTSAQIASPRASPSLGGSRASPSLGGSPRTVLPDPDRHMPESSAESLSDSQPARKKTRLDTKEQPSRSSHRAKGAVVANKKGVPGPDPTSAPRIRHDVRSDPQRAILEWYYSGGRFDVPIWISYSVVRLKQRKLYYTDSMGEAACCEFEPVLVRPEQITAELIRKWGWLITAWPQECSTTLSHGIHRCQNCQSVEYLEYPHDTKPLTKVKKIMLPPPDVRYTGYMVRRQPPADVSGNPPEVSPNGLSWHQICEICIDAGRKHCWVCSSRGRPCYRCKAMLKNIPRGTFLKPLDQWVEGKEPTDDDMWDRLCMIHGWNQSRPVTKSEKQIRIKREASLVINCMGLHPFGQQDGAREDARRYAMHHAERAQAKVAIKAMEPME
ncbi:hypothetical protein CALCODRAFT_528711 [Calocera cornea HHB12733]|uniref:Uncharacterized protein n=1 Tax=Calocera cornea HHB12733 TaxID=1353952 RepID=A0A165DUW8_9BASI|nr:hypothetical protein CALCODRAFT_528711 [Calocera cornea HHB12733]